MLEFDLSQVFSIESGLLFTSKGLKRTPPFIKGFEKTTLYFVDLPVTIKATHKLGERLRVFLSTGPYIGYGLFGTVKYDYSDTQPLLLDDIEEPEDRAVVWGEVANGGYNYSRLDIGLTAGLGIELNKIQFGVSYDYGLSNMEPRTVWIDRNNRVIKFSVGYMLRK